MVTYLKVLVILLVLSSCGGSRKVLQQEFVVNSVLPDSVYTLLIETPNDCWTQTMIMGDPAFASMEDKYIKIYYRQTHEIWKAGDTLKLVKK